MREAYKESLISQMESLTEGNYFNYWVEDECYLIVKLKGKPPRKQPKRKQFSNKGFIIEGDV